MIDQAIKIVN